ncbi:hypothetical protein VE23_10250 [Paenibacillus sp. D9]|nr:hypothetical protein VE23_10250 [Paenibacillus sp. D9]
MNERLDRKNKKSPGAWPYGLASEAACTRSAPISGFSAIISRSAAQMLHLAHAFRAQITFLEISHLLHRSAEDAARTISLQNDVIPLNEDFHRISFVHLVTLAQGFGQHYAAQLVDLSYDSSRFHRLYPLLMSELSSHNQPFGLQIMQQGVWMSFSPTILHGRKQILPLFIVA